MLVFGGVLFAWGCGIYFQPFQYPERAISVACHLFGNAMPDAAGLCSQLFDIKKAGRRIVWEIRSAVEQGYLKILPKPRSGKPTDLVRLLPPFYFGSV